MKIIKSSTFIKNTRGIKDDLIKKRLFRTIKKILQNPEHAPFLTGGNLKGIRKIRMGQFRILYKYNSQEDTLEFIDFDKRSRVYKKFKR